MEANAITAIKQIKTNVIGLQNKRSELDKQIAQFKETIQTLYEINDICTVCDGERHTYDYSLIDGDPYGRSSDARLDCKACSGSGRFAGVKSI
nr:hypothetical protein [Paenibacillus xylanexedens]